MRAQKFQAFVRSADYVLEYGVGFGWNLEYISCARKAGFDVAPKLRSVVEAKGIEFIDDLQKVRDDSFDVILCHHTLEHLRQPSDALAWMRGALRFSGRLLLFVPYEIERKYRTPDMNDRAGHLYSWTPRSLSNLVRSQGFEVVSVDIQRFRFDRAAALAALRLAVGESGYRLIRRIGLMFLPEYEIALIGKKSE